VAIFNYSEVSTPRVADTVQLISVEIFESLQVIECDFGARQSSVVAGEVIPMLALRALLIETLFVLVLRVCVPLWIATEWCVWILDELCDIGVYPAGLGRVMRILPVVF
jgi:hypothetical protein